MSEKITFEPTKWHSCEESDWKTCTENANCYSYILNNPSYKWSVPGLGFSNDSAEKYIEKFNAYFKNVSCADFRQKIIKGATEDGLLPVSEPVEQEGYYLAALFFPASDYDFHWYRKDDNGLWSHKDGWHAPKNKDSDGNDIVDPLKVKDPSFPLFGSYFLVPRSGVLLRENLWVVESK